MHSSKLLLIITFCTVLGFASAGSCQTAPPPASPPPANNNASQTNNANQTDFKQQWQTLKQQALESSKKAIHQIEDWLHKAKLKIDAWRYDLNQRKLRVERRHAEQAKEKAAAQRAAEQAQQGQQ